MTLLLTFASAPPDRKVSYWISRALLVSLGQIAVIAWHACMRGIVHVGL